MTTRTEAKEFESLVARIEEIAAPRGATVTINDRIRNSITNSLQEVDVSIRYRIGSVDIVISIECRKCSRKSDVRWIQELVTKRADLHINKTIAVSATGFSKAARQAAKIHDIEIRTIFEISAKDLQDWFLPTGAVHIFRKIEQMKCVVYLECTDGGPTDYGLETRDEFEPIFFHEKIQSPFPAATLFHLYELSNDEKFCSIPLDGTMTKFEFGISGNLTVGGVPGKLTVKAPVGRYAIHFVHFTALVGYEVASCEPDSGKHHRYTLPSGEIQRSTFPAELFGLPFEFEHLHGPHGEDRVSYRVLNHKKSSGINGDIDTLKKPNKTLE
ncbi:MAG: restriction endonuclease [Planctomycetota bacterium]|nr:restriction endonuclease [Planctomycetota bacterium]MDE1889912.1 restriction endonuclease [Planctomycetota bacterium]MDE2216055.1 restriction endonuclease [Planctomycetota bacterium]